MAALSLFTDEIYHISDLKNVFVRGKKFSVKYTDNKKYAARVLAISNDEDILNKLKSTAEDITEDIGEDWICVSPSELTFVQVSKEITKDTDNNCLFVDKVVLPQYVSGKTCIHALAVDYQDDPKGFFDDTSQFMKLEKRIPTVKSPAPIQPLNSSLVNCEESKDRRELTSETTDDNDTTFLDSRIRWTEEERSTVLSAFEKQLKNGEIPSGIEMQSLIYSNKCLKGRSIPQMRSWLHTQRKKIFINNSGKSSKRGKKKISESYPEVINSKISSESTCKTTVSSHTWDKHDPAIPSKTSSSQITEEILLIPGEIATCTSVQENTNGDDINDERGVECQSSPKKQSSVPEVILTTEQTNSTIPTPDKQNHEVPEALNLYPNTSLSEKIDSKQLPPSHAGGRDTKSVSTLTESPLDFQEDISPISIIHNDNKLDDEDEAGANVQSKRKEQSSNCSVMNNEISAPGVMNLSIPATVLGFKAPQSSIPDLQVLGTETIKPESLPPPYISDKGSNSPIISEDIHSNTGNNIVPTLFEIASKALTIHQVLEHQKTIRSEIKTSQKECSGAKATHHPVKTLDSRESEYENSSRLQEKLLEMEGTIIVTPSASPDFDKRGKHSLVVNINGVPQYRNAPPVKIQLLPNMNSSMTETPLNASIIEEIMQNLDAGVIEQVDYGIDPFNNNVFQNDDVCPFNSPGNMHPAQQIPEIIEPVEIDSATANDPKQLDNWIKNVKVVNFSKIKILSEKGKSTNVKRQLQFSNENPKKITESSSDDDNELGNPVLHSTMNESKIPPDLNGNIEGHRTVTENDDDTPLNESDESKDDDDENYVPEEEDSFEENEDIDLGLDEEDVVESRGVRKPPVARESLNITLGDNPPISAPDDRELHVDTAASTTKKHFCVYCQKMQSKLARHLELVHSEEEDVKKFLHLPPRNKERQQIIGAIRKNGDYLFNTDRRYNTGKLIVCRRPNERMRKTAEDFMTCGSCRGQYAKSDLRHHFRQCTKRDGKRERVATVKGKKIAARVHVRASHDVRSFIFPYLREDEVVRCIRYDELLTIYANKQCQKYGTHQHLYQMIRAKLRLLGRFLLAMKAKDNRISQFADIFNPRFYDTAIEAVQVVAGYDPERRIFKTPAVASNLGTLLKHVGDSWRSECIKTEHVDQQRRVEDFLKLLSEDFGTSINRVVTETQTQNNRRKEIILPSTEDIKKLHNLIKNERCEAFSKLQEGFSYDAWNQLGKMTLLSLQLFNRRRPGEIERLFLEDFRSYRSLDHSANKEAYNALSEEGKKLARKYVRFEIRGKLGRGVPVLVDNEVLECLNLIITHREQAGVPPENLYLFGLPSSDKDRLRYHMACNLMREYSTKCGADIPNTLRGTQLRKHIATRCINLNLTAGQVTDLANFMGHHENIHKKIYRQPVLETDIVKISKILNTAQGFGESDDSEDDGISVPSMSRLSSSRADFNDEPSTSSKSFARKSDQSFGHSTLNPTTPRRWGETERDTVLSTFKKKLAAGRFPSGAEMQKLIDSSPCLKGRTVPQLRSWLHTQKKKIC